ncbi:MAG: sugar transferase [Hydrogenophilales bacterium]
MITRLLDIFFSLFFILLFSPIILIVLIINSFDGSPIFKQERLGINGKVIQIFKFRSMKLNAEEILKNDKELYNLYLSNNFKIPSKKDPRITKFGQFIRKTSIDELPQFFNVLFGSMSIVGPRPIVPSELNNYKPYEKKFLSVKPGITGLWQISGRSKLINQSRINLDLEYIDRKSLFFDLKILFLTPIKIFTRDGAF